MKKNEIVLIIAAILTVVLSIVFFFFDFYNYHFEFKKDSKENTYVALKNGRYFVFLCANDVIDNGVDFTSKPFNDFRVESSGGMFKQNVSCIEEGDLLKKDITFQRNSSKIEVRQKVESSVDLPENSFYYTHIEYPLVAEVKENDQYIELYDLNCTTRIPKKNFYNYKIIDNFIRVGVKYSESFNIIFEMEIECL